MKGLVCLDYNMNNKCVHKFKTLISVRHLEKFQEKNTENLIIKENLKSLQGIKAIFTNNLQHFDLPFIYLCFKSDKKC